LHDIFEKKKVIITGGLGFIGSNLAHKLALTGARVTIVDSLIPDSGGNLYNAKDIKRTVRINICDLRDENSMSVLVEPQDYIFNLAALTSHTDSMTNPYADMEVNCRGQLSLLEACRKSHSRAKIVYAGTRQVYGAPQYLPVDEAHPVLPPDINGVHKFAGEWYHMIYHKAYGLKTTSLRLTNTYGPRMLMKHSRQGFVACFMRQAMDGECITIYGDGKQFRDFNYVDDVTDALLRAAASEKTDGEIYNLGSEEQVTLLDFAKLLIRTCGMGSYRLVPFPSERKKIDIGSYRGNYQKIKETLGWEPRVTLENGLRKTIEFYQAHKAHYW
jgi:UDP-glucose 4-epimerase